MKPRIACLHTAQSNVAVFEAAARGLGVSLSHVVRDDLLFSAEAQGGLTPDIKRQTADALLAMTRGADVVLLTCSTVGPGAEEAAPQSDVPILRTDTALAEAAVKSGHHWCPYLCAVSTTVDPSRALFEAAAIGTGARIEVRQVDPAAWTAFRSGDQKRYLEIVAAAADAALAEGADVVALAQASMAGASALTQGNVISSPVAGLTMAKEVALQRQQAQTAGGAV